jgi:hypothetical protein
VTASTLSGCKGKIPLVDGYGSLGKWYKTPGCVHQANSYENRLADFHASEREFGKADYIPDCPCILEEIMR